MFFPGYTWSNAQSRTPKEKSPWAKPSYLYHSTIPYIAVSQCLPPPHPTSASRASLQPWCLALPSSRSLCSPDFTLYSLFSPCPHSLPILRSPVTFATITTPRSFAQAFCSCFPLPVLPVFLLHCLLLQIFGATSFPPLLSPRSEHANAPRRGSLTAQGVTQPRLPLHRHRQAKQGSTLKREPPIPV